MNGNKIKIIDIAEKSGLSISTVSRVLTGKADKFRISKKSQNLIEQTAKDLNYVPNQYAANLKSGRSNTIALIIPSLNNPFFASMASEINAEVRKRGYITIIGDSDENKDIEREELVQIKARNSEGLIIAPCSQNWDYIKKIYDQGLPVVCIDRYIEGQDIPYVSTDNFEGAYLATKHLIDYGHTRIACIQGVKDSTPNQLRLQGYKKAMSDSGIDSYRISGDEFSVQNGYLETKILLGEKEMPTAIFTLSNTIAMGCIKALKEENMSIPEDISIITFDDHPYLDFLETPLTCITQPIDDICKIAIKYLFTMLSDKNIELKRVLLKPELKYRKSVKRIN